MILGASLADWLSWVGELLPGLLVSLKLTAAILVVGLPLGLLLALAVSGSSPVFKWLGLMVVELGRGTPALLLIYLVYFGLPQAGVTLESFTAAIVALGFNSAAYSSEVFRAGLNAVPRSQREAAQAIGLTPWKELWVVVLPQALRIVIPPIIGFAILVFQGTSLTFAIAIPEMLSRAYNTGNVTFRIFELLALAALLYAAISVPVSQIVNHLDMRSRKRP